MFMGFGCWFYAGYTYGGTKVRIKKRKYENRQAPPPRFPNPAPPPPPTARTSIVETPVGIVQVQPVSTAKNFLIV